MLYFLKILIIYKSTNKPNQSLFLAIYPFTNTLFGPTSLTTTLDIFTPTPPTPPNSPCIKQSDLDNTVKYVDTDIK